MSEHSHFPVTKSARQQRIVEVLATGQVRSQTELADRLNADGRGFDTGRTRYAPDGSSPYRLYGTKFSAWNPVTPSVRRSKLGTTTSHRWYAVSAPPVGSARPASATVSPLLVTFSGVRSPALCSASSRNEPVSGTSSR